jgi:hypothetical protein
MNKYLERMMKCAVVEYFEILPWNRLERVIKNT